MIIVCKNCKASYLVASTSVGSAPRTVRCGRCKSVWVEVPHTKTPAEPAAKPKRPTPPPPPIPPSALADILAQAQKGKPPTVTPEPVTAASDSSGILDELKAITISRAQKLLLVAATVAFGFTLFSSIVFVGAHSFIIEHFPEAQQLYVMLGLAENPLKDNLILHKITSERRYQDGAMQLFINGQIHSMAKEKQVVPPIHVEAVGPDGKIIESWRIDPPQATINPKETLSFTSSTISPEGTVVEVNLSFVDLPHDEH